MTPKEKAIELCHKFYLVNSETVELNTGEYDIVFSLDQRDAKQCALVAVDEILGNFGNLTDGKQHYCAYSTIQYYKEVKEEIEKL